MDGLHCKDSLVVAFRTGLVRDAKRLKVARCGVSDLNRRELAAVLPDGRTVLPSLRLRMLPAPDAPDAGGP